MADLSAVGRGLVLRSGQVAVLDDPDVELQFLDLLYGLGAQHRYAGQISVSVLHHLYLCALLAKLHYPGDLAVARYAVAHDLHEAYFPDLIRPLKVLLPESKLWEEKWEAWVHARLGLQFPRSARIERAVKHLDDRAVVVEVVVWGHPFARHFWKHHGGEPSPEERAQGQLVASEKKIRIYNLLRQILPAIPSPSE